jgi:hypothetical protein
MIILPEYVRQQLRDISLNVEPHKPEPGSSKERTTRIDDLVRAARMAFPEAFWQIGERDEES